MILHAPRGAEEKKRHIANLVLNDILQLEPGNVLIVRVWPHTGKTQKTTPGVKLRAKGSQAAQDIRGSNESLGCRTAKASIHTTRSNFSAEPPRSRYEAAYLSKPSDTSPSRHKTARQAAMALLFVPKLKGAAAKLKNAALETTTLQAL